MLPTWLILYSVPGMIVVVVTKPSLFFRYSERHDVVADDTGKT